MKISDLAPSATLRPVLVILVLLAALIVLAPRPAAARLVVRVDAGPVRIISAPRASCVVRPATRLRTCVAGPRSRVVITAGPHRKAVRTVERFCTCRSCRPRVHRAVREIERVWVPGHWVRTGPRTSRWVPGHWERV